MDCDQICDLLAAYLDGEVTPEEKAQIEAHLPGCLKCRAELESLAAVRDNLRVAFHSAAGEVEPPPHVWSRVQYRLNRERGRRGFWPVFRTGIIATASTAVVALIVFFAVMFFGGLKMGSPPPAPVSTPTMTTSATTTATATTTRTATTTTVPQTTVASSTITPAPCVAPGVTFSRLPDIVSNYGEEVKIDLSFSNQAPEMVMMNPFPPGIRIIKLPNVTPPDNVVRTFPAGKNEFGIPPGGTASYAMDWDQKDDGGQQVAPGWYGVKVTVISRDASGATSRTSGVAVRVLVLPPEGVLQKTIEVNQSQTAVGLPFDTGNGTELIDLNITLQQVEMTADSVGFTVMVTSPAYVPPQAPGLPNPLWMLGAYATYTVDGTVHDAGVAAMNPGENSLTLRWGYGLDKIDPIPLGARELTFTITKIRDWEGPWTFELRLE
jgi:predicted anti-sigma-YlaC factor YlaD